MKTKRGLLLCGAALLCAVVGLISGKHRSAPVAKMEKVLGLELSSGCVVEDQQEDHGVHGDGISFLVVEFQDDAFLKQIESSADWYRLPVDNTLKTLFYGQKWENEQQGPYLTGEDGMPLFPVVQNGYYWFRDRHPQLQLGEQRVAILQRPSFNFTAALYDSEARLLYFAEMDT